MLKDLKHFFFRVKRKLSIELFNQNLYDGKMHIYLTLRCNYNCPYCVDNYNKPDFDGYGYKLRSVEEWSNKINALKRDVIFTGGEPFLYKHDGLDLIDLINRIDKRTHIDIYTNLGIDIRDKLPKLKRKINLMVSFHPYEAKSEIFFPNIDSVRSHNKIKYFVHAVDADDNMSHPLIPVLQAEMHKRDIPIHIDKDQGFEGSSRKFKMQATCSRKIILLGPDGTRYQCVGKLTRRADHLENIFEGGLKDELSVIDCHEYGYCAPCDWLGETKIDVHGMIPSIPTVREHIHKSYEIS